MPYTIGSKIKSTFLKTESHKLFQEFEVNTSKAVKAGQPVVMEADEKIGPITTSSSTQAIIGIAMQDGAAGELVTVMMKAFAIIYAECETDSLAVGPVRIGSSAVYNATTGYVLIDDASVDHSNQIGWALKSGDDGDVVPVAIL